MYDDDYSKSYSNGSGGGIFACIVVAIIIAITFFGCSDKETTSRVIEIRQDNLSKQLSVCEKNEGVQRWTVTVKRDFVVKSTVICNNGMVKDFQAKDM